MNKITICACSSRTFIRKETVARLAASAQKAGVQVELVDDLCEMCEDKAEAVHEVAKSVICACHSRAVKSLMAFVGEDNVEHIDLRGDDAMVRTQLDEKMASAWDGVTEGEMAEWLTKLDAMPRKLGEDAWYPTIDKNVCCECGKCLEFCPFGVYEMVDDRIRVVHPHHCKNNCPACARTCPASAIIFPKYDRSPINGGEEKQEQAVQMDTKTLYNETFRQKLALRKLKIEK